MGSPVSVLTSIIGSVAGKALSGVMGIGKKSKKKMTPTEPKELLKQPDVSAQRRLASQYGGQGSTLLTGTQGLEDTATTSKSLLGG